MKKVFSLFLLACSLQTMAQSNINDLLAAGLSDAEKFTTSYMAPVSEGLMYSMSNGWYNSGKSKPLLGFEISVIGNITSFKNNEDKKGFILNTADYENIQFQDGSTSKMVSTALGDIEGENVIIAANIQGNIVNETIELPSGLASEDINFVPSGFIQASVGLIKGTEIKARFLPKIDADGAKVGFYGVGLQHEFTSHLPASKIFPIAISGVIGYTHLDGSYDLESTNAISGDNQSLELEMNTWVFQAVVSTKLPIINFYGGIGYISGKSEVGVLGTYEVSSSPLPITYVDPFSLDNKISGVTGNIGAKLKLGFFRLHADYTLAEFNSVSFGVNLGFR